jgi:hypothetical protein
VWTFQTAFRWLFPSIRADGRWTDQFSDLLQLNGAPLGPNGVPQIDKATWDRVVGGTRLDAHGVVTAPPTDRFAVYETPWQPPGDPKFLATEVDVIELVQPASSTNGIWNVFSEKCVVDVLLHHRDTRQLATNDAYIALFWLEDPDPAVLMAEPAAKFAMLNTWAGTSPVPTPAGWSGGAAVFKLPATLDAFMPRAVSIDLDLNLVHDGNHLLLLAVCGSSADVPPPLPGAMTGTATIGDLVRTWPRAALRLLKVTTRPPAPPP